MANKQIEIVDAPSKHTLHIEPRRAALDFLDTASKLPISDRAQADLQELYDSAQPLKIEYQATSSAPILLDLHPYQYVGGWISFRDRAHRVVLKVRKPRGKNSEKKKERYEVRVQIYGKAFSSRIHGVTYAKWVLMGIIERLYRDKFPKSKRRKARVGRSFHLKGMHLAFDISIDPSDAPTALNSIFTQKTDDLFKGFVSRAKYRGDFYREKKSDTKDYVTFGDLDGGKSLALGRSLRLSIYERDKCRKNLALLREVYDRLGIPKEHRILRAEFQLKEEILPSIILNGLPLNRMRLFDVLKSAKDIAQKLFKRIRHTTPSKGRRTDWPKSPLWLGFEACIQLFTDFTTKAPAVTTVVNREHAAAVARRRSRISHDVRWLLNEGGVPPLDLLSDLATASGLPWPRLELVPPQPSATAALPAPQLHAPRQAQSLRREAAGPRLLDSEDLEPDPAQAPTRPPRS